MAVRLSSRTVPLRPSGVFNQGKVTKDKLAVEGDWMEPQELNVKVGDRVVISRPRLAGSFASSIDRFSTVSAVRTKSFDAGGLCFRNDGREWGGHNRVRLMVPDEVKNEAVSPAAANDGSSLDRAERGREDAILAFLLSSRHEKEWLKLGLPELRRIAALHGIKSTRKEPLEAASARGMH
jgi:hypothetical protein